MVYRHLLYILLTGLLFMLAACAAGPQPDAEHQVFPPPSLLPLDLAITQPLVPFSHQASHEALESWNRSPGQRRMLMRCVWLEGLINLTQTMIPGTTITYLGIGKDPLAAVGPGVEAQTDSLGKATFNLQGHSTLDLALRRGWTHLIVPYDLQYSENENGKGAELAATVAIVDVLEKRIVWQGIVDSRHGSPGDLGADDSTAPALTSYETATYLFILDLASIMGRRLSPKPDSRHQLAPPCQDPPPLLQ